MTSTEQNTSKPRKTVTVKKVGNRGTESYKAEVGKQNWAGDAYRKVEQDNLAKIPKNKTMHLGRGVKTTTVGNLSEPKPRPSTEGMTRVTNRGTGSRTSKNKGEVNSMETYQTMSWKKLQDEYSKNMTKFDDSVKSLEESSSEIKKIYSQVMKKSKDDSAETRKEFAKLWLKHIDVENDSSFLEIKDEYDTFLKGPLPSVADYKNFEATLNQKLCQKSISLLETYADSLKGFFDAWKETWKNKI